jgi:hypothetical protein
MANFAFIFIDETWENTLFPERQFSWASYWQYKDEGIFIITSILDIYSSFLKMTHYVKEVYMN